MIDVSLGILHASFIFVAVGCSRESVSYDIYLT